MKPRCQGAKTPGHFTSFECVLDDGHGGFCEPYVPPSVDEWRALIAQRDALKAENVRLAGIWPEMPPFSPEGGGLPRYGIRWNGPDLPLAVPMDDGYWTPWHLADAMRAHVARLQAELDALRAIIESGAESVNGAAGLLAKVKRGDYQWPSGVAWAVGEAHRLLTGGPPDGVYVRAQGDAGSGPGAVGTP